MGMLEDFLVICGISSANARLNVLIENQDRTFYIGRLMNLMPKLRAAALDEELNWSTRYTSSRELLATAVEALALAQSGRMSRERLINTVNILEE